MSTLVGGETRRWDSEESIIMPPPASAVAYVKEAYYVCVVLFRLRLIRANSLTGAAWTDTLGLWSILVGGAPC